MRIKRKGVKRPYKDNLDTKKSQNLNERKLIKKNVIYKKFELYTITLGYYRVFRKDVPYNCDISLRIAGQLLTTIVLKTVSQ